MPQDLSVRHYSDIVAEINTVSLADEHAYSIAWEPASETPRPDTTRCVILTWQAR